MAHPFPDLAIYPLSGLSFPWAFFHPDVLGNFGASLGPDGVSTSEVMVIHFEDLQTAVTELLGYSYRDTTNLVADGRGTLRRKLPWMHPYFNQLWLKRISDVKAGPMCGTNFANPQDVVFNIRGGFVGPGQEVNLGPWTNFELAFLTLQFWRPPYYVRTDADIVVDGEPQEWLRYVDKHWEQSVQMLQREGCQYHWGGSQGVNTSPGPPGAIGTPVVHQKLTKRWYQVPEACLFEATSPTDLTLNGDTPNQMYMRSTTSNPITNYVIQPGTNPGDAGYRSYPIMGCINSPLDGGVDDSDASLRFFGCPMGTLRLDGVEFIPRELQLPAALMQIPFFNGSEPISQQQYDVVFHFDRFDPPRSSTVARSVASLASGALVREAYRGHNLVPRAGDGMWYGIVSQNNIGGTAFKGTPFNYAVFSDLFRSL